MIDKAVGFLASDKGKALTVVAMLCVYGISFYLNYVNLEKAKIELAKQKAPITT